MKTWMNSDQRRRRLFDQMNMNEIEIMLAWDWI